MMLLAALFLCPVTSIHDGDTFRCADGTAVRLQAIDAPEIGPCRGRRGRICVPGNGQASRRYLAALIAGRTLTCRRTGRSYERVTAWCSAGGRDLSCAMVRARMAAYEPRYDRRQQLCR